MQRPYGFIKFLRGKTDFQGEIAETVLEDQPKARYSASLASVFPQTMGESSFYTREPIDFDASSLNGRDLYVARFDALPESYSPQENQVVWVSGSRSWRKLCERGVWVNGSHEGLGESEGLPIESIMGRKADFVKLSHGEKTEISQFPVIPTYRLIDKNEVPNLQSQKYFYWASFSNYIRAVKKYPQIRAARHACGPGHTYKLLKDDLGQAASVDIFLSYQDWIEQFY